MSDIEDDVPQFNMYFAHTRNQIDFFRLYNTYWKTKNRQATMTGIMPKGPKTKDFVALLK